MKMCIPANDRNIAGARAFLKKIHILLRYSEPRVGRNWERRTNLLTVLNNKRVLNTVIV